MFQPLVLLLAGLPGFTGPTAGPQAPTDEQLEPLAQGLATYAAAREAGQDVDAARVVVAAGLMSVSMAQGVARPALTQTESLGRALRLSQDLARESKRPRPGKVVEDVYAEGSFAAGGLAFAYRTPKELEPDGAWPLILALPDHEQGPAEHLRANWTSAAVRDGALVVCPAMPADRADWTRVQVDGRPGGLSHVVTALRLAAERFPVDFDRVYVVGHGRSVAAALAAGDFSPHAFAGVVGRSGDVGEQTPVNFTNLPTLLTGAGAEAEAFEAAARADGRAPCTLVPDADEDAVWGWMQEHTRDAFPHTVHLAVGKPFPTRIGWLRVSPTAPDAAVTATIQREENRIVVNGNGISHVTLYLNDRLVDLDRPIRLVCNGLARKLTVERSLPTLLNLIDDGTSDPGCVYVAEVFASMTADVASEVARSRITDEEHARRLESAGDDGLLALREAYLAAGDPVRSAEVLRRALRLFPESVEVRELAGHVRHGERWFATQANLDRFLARQVPEAAEARGHVRHRSLWMHPDEKALASKGWQRDPNTGLWETPEDRRQLERGAVRQDLEWVSERSAAHVDAGLWRVDGEWLELDEANRRHARLDHMWRIPTPDILLYTTVDRATAEAALIQMARAVGDLRRVFGVEPVLPLPVALLNSEEQVDQFAFGAPDGRRWPTHAGRTHVIQGAFFAERWFEQVDGERVFRGMGVGFWDPLVPYGDSYGVHCARLAVGHSYVDALDPSPKAVRAALARGPGADYSEAWHAEKRFPDWLRWGAAVYAERYFHDDQVVEGGDPWWARAWTLENLAARGGARPIEEILAFELDPGDREDAQKLLIEAGLLVAFMVDGECEPVREAHADLVRALLAGRLHSKQFTALEEALLAHAAELAAFAG